MAGATTGVVEADDLLGPHRIVAGAAVVALASSGLHSNGYSLARRVFFEHAGWDVDRHVDELGRTLGEELLEPTRIYAQDCLALVRDLDVQAMAHVTGGGLAANLARVMPAGLGATLDRSTWTPPAVFGLVADLGVEQAELERALNMGVGMAVVLPEAQVEAALRLLAGRGVPAWLLGRVDDSGEVRLVGSHP